MPGSAADPIATRFVCSELGEAHSFKELTAGMACSYRVTDNPTLSAQ